MSFKNPIKIGTNDNLGVAINELINTKIKLINTCFLAKVVSIYENRVDVVDIIKKNDDIINPVIKNCLIAQPFSQSFSMNFKVTENDIGVCIVCKQDITNFKDTGSEAVANTQRTFNLNDSIFIPLSLYNADITQNEIKSDNNISVSSPNIEIKSNEPIVIGSQSGTLSDLCDNLVQLMDLLASGMKGSATEASAYQSGKNAIIQQIKSIVG